MLSKSLAAGLLAGMGLFVGAATVCAGDTVVLQRVKNDGVVQNLVNDGREVETQDVHYRGHGGWHGHVGGYYHHHYSPYRAYYGFSYYPRYYYPRFSVGVYAYPTYYYSYPTYVTPPVYYSSPLYLNYPTTQTASVSTPVFRLKIDTPVRPAVHLGPATEQAPPPRLEQPADRTFPYDGVPQAPVPMLRPDPANKAKPADAPDDGKVVSLPARTKLAYPAYGDEPAQTQFAEDRAIVSKTAAAKKR